MQNKQSYENFPVWIPLLSCVLSLSIYALGTIIFSRLAILLAVLYLIFCLWLELKIFQKSCANCYYYGKMCGLGRGKLCALLFKKGNPEEFINKEISYKEILPDLLLLIFPLVGGIIILIRDFTWPVLILIVMLAVLSSGGNAIMRGSLACKFCKQKELGCPAQQLFEKTGRQKTNGGL